MCLFISSLRKKEKKKKRQNLKEHNYFYHNCKLWVIKKKSKKIVSDRYSHKPSGWSFVLKPYKIESGNSENLVFGFRGRRRWRQWCRCGQRTWRGTRQRCLVLSGTRSIAGTISARMCHCNPFEVLCNRCSSFWPTSKNFYRRVI